MAEAGIYHGDKTAVAMFFYHSKFWGSDKEVVSSAEQLRSLVENALATRKTFAVGENLSRCIWADVILADTVLLELHRGKKYEGWISPNIKHENAVQLLLDFYEQGNLSDEVLKGDGQVENEWVEAAANPYILIAFCLALAALAAYGYFFRGH